MDELAAWDDFFSGFTADIRRPLLKKFRLTGNGRLEDQADSLSVEQFDLLEKFRSDVVALSSPDSRALETATEGVRDLEFSGLERPYDLAGWLYLNEVGLFNAGIELLQFDLGFNKLTMWSGFHVDAAFSNDNHKPSDPALAKALAACFSTKRLKEPDVKIIALRRPSGRSDSRAVVLVVSVEGPLQSHRVVKGPKGRKRTALEHFHPERRAAVLFDDKARTIDIVSSEMGATLRKKVVQIALQHLGVPKPKLDRLQARWVNVDRLGSRFPFRINPETDGVLRVRLVGARISRQSAGIVSVDARDCDAKDAWEAWHIWGKSGRDSFGAVDMLGATLQFSFPDIASSDGERQRMLRLHRPYGLTMQNWPKAHKEIAESLLERWELLRLGPDAE